MAQWVRVATIDEIPDGAGQEFVAEGRIIALYRTGNSFHALDGVCPHAGGPLAKGRLDGCIVTCPWHGWQFDITNGRHCLNTNLTQPSFPVKVEGTDVWVELP
jgi:nitrite reductase (NADH) small subunit